MIDRSENPITGAGFRFFFVCTVLAAVVVMAVWLPGYTKRHPLLTYYGSSGWHAHEMLFGYMTAVAAGLLIALRTPPGHPVAGPVPLSLLVVLWLAGRALPLTGGVPPWLVAAVDLAFLPLLTAVLARPLLKAYRRDAPYLIAPLAVMALANLLVHAEWLGWAMDSARLGVVLAIYMLLLLITVLAGGVIAQCLARNPPVRPILDRAAAASVVIVAAADLFAPTVQAVVVCVLLAAAVHAWRWIVWLKAGPRDAVAWALLAGYGWLIAGLVLIALSYGGYMRHMLAFHALMVGGFGGLSLGMMAHLARTRRDAAASVPPPAVLAFVIMNLAAVVRVAGPLLSVRYEKILIIAAGALWIISFILFLLVYAPWLLPLRSAAVPVERRESA
jgi:uncharacterized protein involved in response to NO